MLLIVLALALVLAGAVFGGAGMRRLGRWTARATGRWRAGSGVTAVLLLFGGLAVSVRGAWMLGLPLAAAGLGLATLTRRRPATPATPVTPEIMSRADACAVLGVASDASPAEVQAAWRRLMQRAHPDQGGSPGLARQLNAARDRLLNG